MHIIGFFLTFLISICIPLLLQRTLVLKSISAVTHLLCYNTKKYFQNHYSKLPSLINPLRKVQDFPGGVTGKESACQLQESPETWVWSLGRENSLEKEMATCSSILAWKIPWTEEPGGLQSMGSQSDMTEHTHNACIHKDKRWWTTKQREPERGVGVGIQSQGAKEPRRKPRNGWDSH